MTSQDALKRLRELVKSAGGNVYERTKLAAALLADKEWIATEHKGDDFAALDALEADYFHDLAVPLTDLIRLYQRFPSEATWSEHNYKLRKMLSLLKPEPRKRDPVRRVTIKEFEAVEQEKKHFEAANRTLDKNYRAAKSEVETLRERVTTLGRENARLRGRVEQLERIVQGKLANVG